MKKGRYLIVCVHEANGGRSQSFRLSRDDPTFSYCRTDEEFVDEAERFFLAAVNQRSVTRCISLSAIGDGDTGSFIPA